MVCVCHIPVYYIIYYTICQQACQERKKASADSAGFRANIKNYLKLSEKPLSYQVDPMCPNVFSKKRGQTVRFACYIVVCDKNTARHIFIMQNEKKKRKTKKKNIRKNQKRK